ncbi:MAG TPA: DUF4097 family beta strand repeat-containing protein [Terriglobia bacterium]|nr:DUF4097 family beta strand repeat-containing protein [Terriglobia bacterium]
MPGRRPFEHRAVACLSAALALLVSAGILPAAGQGRVEKSFRAIPNCRIHISNPTGGAIVVRGWDKAEVHAVCVTNSPKVEVDSEPTPANAEAERLDFATHVLNPQATLQERMVSYELDVPRDSNLVISSPEGSISVENISGDDWINSVKAAISVTDGAGLIQVRSLNGDINLVRPSGHIEATSIMGNLTITGSHSQKINAQTESGKITFDGDFLPIGDYLLKTYAGDINVICPSSDSFSLDAQSLRGKMDNQFKLRRKSHVPYSRLGGSSSFGTNGPGEASVTVKSYSGAIHMRPRP